MEVCATVVSGYAYARLSRLGEMWYMTKFVAEVGMGHFNVPLHA